MEQKLIANMVSFYVRALFLTSSLVQLIDLIFVSVNSNSIVRVKEVDVRFDLIEVVENLEQVV